MRRANSCLSDQTAGTEYFGWSEKNSGTLDIKGCQFTKRLEGTSGGVAILIVTLSYSLILINFFYIRYYQQTF